MKHVVCTVPFLLLVACGGGGAPPKSADSAYGGPGDKHESIGEAVAAQGGLASLGGAGNREEGGTGVEVAFGGVLHVENVDPKSPVKLDGVLKEWPARTQASERLSGKTDGLGLAIATQMDDAKLYVGGEITDA